MRNRSLGLELNTAVDWVPASVHKLDSTGLVALWNQEHPEFRIYPGDEIIRANRIVWHHNSKVFGSRIESQFSHMAQRSSPSNEVLSLHVQRPRSVVENLEDRVFVKEAGEQGGRQTANVSYARGWLATIPVSVGHRLGLELNATDDWLPVTVAKIEKMGAVHMFNEDNPDDALVPGDQIFKVNHVMWRRTTRTRSRSSLTSSSPSPPRRAARARYDCGSRGPRGSTQTPGQPRTDNADYMEFTAELDVPTTPSETMGWGLNATDGAPVSVGKIMQFGSVTKWNKENPIYVLKEIEPGDRIVQVEDNVWSNDTKPFMKRLGLQLKSRGKRTISVLFQRFFNETSDENDDNGELGDGDVMGAEQ
ncbi:unnamed protein product [Prorocentrum cordatum]|uniref:PDZ domain-containing protein n=1 Tax=Prorocentrum cordatum TaxID=2364126 RepID=A0ABN9U320_9DINO|nr:unnamed protein product [Polarella glacialis]